MPSSIHPFDEQDVQRINAAVAAAEAKTAAQIVPAVAACSGRYDRAEDIFGLLLGIALAAGVWLFLPDAEPGGDSWAGYTSGTKLAFMAAALLAGFVGGAALASHVWILRRPFVPKPEARRNVARAARGVFFDRSLHHTAAGTGLLIYLSMDERRAVLLADRAVLEALTQPTLDTLCRDLTTLVRDADAAEALCQTIRRAGELLAAALPATAEQDDALSNELIVIS